MVLYWLLYFSSCSFIKQSLEYDEIERFDLPPAWEDDDLLDYNDNVEDIQQDAFAVENIGMYMY